MKDMTVVEFLRKKNEIIKKHTGLILVPEAQIVEVAKVPLSMNEDINACPYCKIWFSEDCIGCPMAANNNDCYELKSTYQTIVNYLGGSIVSSIHTHDELLELIDEFNKGI